MAESTATKKTKSSASAKPRKPRKVPTPADVKATLEKARKRVQALEKKAFATEIDAVLREKNVVSAIGVIKANVKGVTNVAILDAIAKAAGMLRIDITLRPAPATKKK